MADIKGTNGVDGSLSAATKDSPNKDTEAMAEEAAEAVLEEDEDGMETSEVLENGDGDGDEEEEDTEGDGKKKTKKPRYFIPSRLEFRQDRIREQQERTVMIGPTAIDDLSTPKLMQCIRGSTQFFIRFFKDDHKAAHTEANGETPVKIEKSDEDFKGHIEIRFNSVQEAEECVEALKNVREGLSARRITYEYTKEDEYKEMRKIGNPQDSEGLTGHRASRMVTIPGISPDITRDMITEKVPDAVEVMIPKATSGENIKGYAYVELPNAQKAKELENTSIEFDEKSHKCYTLLEIPALDSVIRRIDKERVADTPTKPMEQAKRDRLRLLLRYASHYERVEDLPEAKVEAIKKRIAQIRKRLRAESRRAATGGKGGGRGGKGAGRGSRGSGRGRGGGGWVGNGMRGGYNGLRGRGSGYAPMGYGQRPMTAPTYQGGYGYNNGYGYPGGYDEFDYGRGDYGHMNQGYGPSRGGGMRGQRGTPSYYRPNNPRGGW